MAAIDRAGLRGSSRRSDRVADILICGVLILIGFGCGRADMDLSIVNLDSGTISGTMDAGVRVFQGIPYAAPPTGDRRWKPPR